jgi:RNA polymerase sigma factor (sigma-70 family)
VYAVRRALQNIHSLQGVQKMQRQPNQSVHATTEDASNPGHRPHDDVNLNEQLTRGFAAKMIRQKAKQLVGHFGLMKSDREDIEQELKLALLERFDRFNPNTANWEAFTTMIVDHRIASLIDERWAEKREFCHNVVSLATQVPDTDGEQVELAQQIGGKHQERVTGVSLSDPIAEVELAHDLDVVCAKLPPDLRELVERLKYEPVAQIARDMGVSRRTLRDRVSKLRAHFEADDLQEYLAN